MQPDLPRSDFPHHSSARSARSVTKNPPRFKARPSRCCSRAATCSARPRPAPARPPRSRCRCSTRLSKDAKNRGKVRALVLVPTRELAMQVAEALHKYAKGSNLNVVPVYGGAPMDHQIRALRARHRGRGRHAWPRARSPAPQARSISAWCKCWFSTKPTRCSTWASRKTSMRSSPRRPRRGRPPCLPPPSRRASCRSPGGT